MTTADDIDAIRIGPDPDKLLVYNRQQLSAMLDGELSPDEAKFMLRRLQHDGELAQCWERWQVCGDMLRGRHHALLPSNFADRVAAALHDDAAVAGVAVQSQKSPRFMRWGGGAALAASVALVAVFAARQLPEPVQSPQVGQPMLASAASAETPVVQDAPADATAVPSPIDAAPAVVAAALAVAEAPRRSAERRARNQSQRNAVAAQSRAVDAAPDAMALAHDDRAAFAIGNNSQQAAGSVFPPAPALQSRPWPRAILPGAESPLAAGYGRLPTFAAEAGGYDPFRPRIADPLVMTPTQPGESASATQGAPQPDRTP